MTAEIIPVANLLEWVRVMEGGRAQAALAAPPIVRLPLMDNNLTGHGLLISRARGALKDAVYHLLCADQSLSRAAANLREVIDGRS